MLQKLTGNAFRTTLICIDHFKNDDFRGRICNPCLSGSESFDSLMQMLLKMDALLDEMHFPQSFAAKREFSPVERPLMAGGEPGGQSGTIATFAIRVLFRQNASWQGSVTWLEDGREESFRSVLELVFLMHSALTVKTAATS